MPTYIYTCDQCDAQLAIEERGSYGCPACLDGELRRDYKAEGANVNIANLKATREAGK